MTRVEMFTLWGRMDIKYTSQSAPEPLFGVVSFCGVGVDLCSVYSGMMDSLRVYLCIESVWSASILGLDSSSDRPRLLIGLMQPRNPRLFENILQEKRDRDRFRLMQELHLDSTGSACVALRPRYGRVTAALRLRRGVREDRGHSSQWVLFHQTRCVMAQKRPRSASALGSAQNKMQVYFRRGALQRRRAGSGTVRASGPSPK